MAVKRINKCLWLRRVGYRDEKIKHVNFDKSLLK